MEAGNNGFRSALFGGFNRKDVLKFFEEFARENNKKIENISAELERVKEENETLRKEMMILEEELHQLRGENGGRMEAEAKMKVSLERKSEELLKNAEALERANGKLVEAGRELAELKKQVAVMEPQARRYEILKDRVATVELEAHQKAEVIVEAAKKEERALRAETAEWMSEIRKNYATLRDQVRENAAAAAKAEADFMALEENYGNLIRNGLGEEEQS